METILITGGTGLTGTVLTKLLAAEGYQIIILTRNKKSKSDNRNITFSCWDYKKNVIDAETILKADHIIHLAGAGVVDHKWTKSYQQEIIDSRTKTIELIINQFKNKNHHLKSIISSSAIGWYGPDKPHAKHFTEETSANTDFLGRTCRLWEEAAEQATDLGIRVCKVRTGIVLSNQGGALKEFLKPIKMGVAAILGNGNQMVSWIHIQDLCRIYLHLLNNQQLNGSFNAVAPVPVSNKILTLELARIVRGRYYIPIHVPAFIIKLMMGKRSVEVLKSTTVSAEKIHKSGFTYLYPSIESALSNIFAKG